MKIEYFASPEIKPLTQHSGHLGWYSETDWECFLRTGVVFGHRLQSGEIVSSAFMANYQNRVGWLGAVIVNSRFQGKKLGRDLIQKAISIAPDENFVLALIATERGKRMYEQAGFVEIGNTHKFIAELVPSLSDLRNIRKYESNDFENLVRLDSEASGFRRSKVLLERLRTRASAFVSLDEHNEINGFVIASHDGQRISIGSLVAPSQARAESLLTKVTEAGGSFRIDIPHWQSQFIRHISNQGFQLERICPLLTYKGRELPKASDNYFAVVSQAFG